MIRNRLNVRQQPPGLQFEYRKLVKKAGQSASTSFVIPATSAVGQLDFDIPDKAVPSGQEHYGPEQWRTVSPHFFKVFRIPLMSGRVFTEHDDLGGAPIVIVSAAFARKYFANESPIGRTLDIGKGIGPTSCPIRCRTKTAG